MARIADEKKLEAIKSATRNIVVMEGISSASISRIATKAGVSTGYLYRYYSGKRELLEDLFEESSMVINNLLRTYSENKSTIKEMVAAFTTKIFEVASTNIEAVSFQHRLLSDYSFEIPERALQEVRDLFDEIVEWGHETQEINPRITAEHFYVIAIGGLLEFINIRTRGFFKTEPFTQEDVDKQIAFILKAVK